MHLYIYYHIFYFLCFSFLFKYFLIYVLTFVYIKAITVTKDWCCTNFSAEFEVAGAFIETEASNPRRRAGRFNARSPRSKEFHLQIPLHVLRTGSIAKEFLLDRGFRVWSKVRNGETTNGPSGMICAQHTQELQNRRGKIPSSPPSQLPFSSLSLPLPWYVWLVYDIQGVR